MGDVAFHRLLDLFEGSHFDLAHALARYAEFVREFFEGDRFVGEAPCFEDPALAVIEHGERFTKRLVPVLGLLAFGEPALLAGAVVHQPIHPPESPSSRMGALSEASPPSRRFMSMTSCSVTPSRLAMSLTWSGRISPSSSAEMRLLALRKLKNSFF